MVGTILEASVFLFEIPTGIVADTKSRKLSIVIGYVLIGAGFIIEGFFPYFITIAISQVFWGIGYTFTSGATQAWITDEIGEERAGNAFVKGAQAGQAGELIAIPISIVIGLIAIRLPIIFGGILMVVFAVFLAVVMQEHGFKPKPKEESSNWRAVFDTVKTTNRYIKGNNIIILLLAIGIFYGLYSEGFDRLWTAHFVEDFVSPIITVFNSVFFIGVVRAILIILSIIALNVLNKKLDLKKSNHVIKVQIGGGPIVGLFGKFFSIKIALLVSAISYHQ